jgi:hypothetical protein
MSIVGGLVSALFTSAFLFGAAYFCYWCFRGARHAWGALTGQPIVRRPSGLSPRASKAFHVAGTVAAVGTVLLSAVVVLFLIGLSRGGGF